MAGRRSGPARSRDPAQVRPAACVSAWAGRGLAVPLALLLLPSGDADPARRLRQDAYVWQRSWTPGLAAALRRTAPLVDGYRVLVAEVAADGRLVRETPDWVALHALHLPLVAVIRIDGRTALPPPSRMQGMLAALPVPVSGVEIDHDCGTAHLDGYRRFLRALRPMLLPGLPLSITALPDWLSSAAFRRLSRVPDRLVLQVHAADDPRRGLFDPARAVHWAWLMQRRSARPFLLSLPAYGVRVVLDRSGRVVSTEAEEPALAGSGGIELAAPPVVVADAVRSLEHDPPPGLVGLAWFRLPLPGDRRAWSWTSWEAVLARRPLSPSLVLRVTGAPGTLHGLWMENRSAIDAALPRTIRFAVACARADATGPYRLRPDAPTLMLDTASGMLLRAGAAIAIGWSRCDLPDGVVVPPG